MGHIRIIGGGLAGSEAAWQCLKRGHTISLYEMRPIKMTEAHRTGNLAELVCSNSLKSLDENSAAGLLKDEMTQFSSLILEAARAAQVPAGGALAVDREQFSAFVENRLNSHPGFKRINGEITDLASLDGDDPIIVATGPLTTDSLARSLLAASGAEAESLYFYDAIAPVLSADSINMDICYYANRYGKGTEDSADEGDYINVPLNKEQYEKFIADVTAAEMTPLHAFESTQYFESCLPIEVMVERGPNTLRFGPMKPVGLDDPRTGKRPWAVIQLRQENKAKTMFSMVGFQTKMKWGEQKRIFSSLPGLEEAEFLRFGSVHRNTYLHSPKILAKDLSLKLSPRVFLAGQVTGVEGYLESSAIGLLAGRFAADRVEGREPYAPPATTMLGALHDYITVGPLGKYQPMNTNMGLLPGLENTGGKRKISKQDRRLLMCQRARADFKDFLANNLLHN